MSAENEIFIVCAVDNPYAMMATTMIKSLEHNHQSHEGIQICIINNGLTKRSQRKLVSSIHSPKITIDWLNVNEEYIIQLGLGEYYESLTTHYYRLLIPYLVPDTVSKVIYLDCDLLVLEDIGKLWRQTFDDNVILAIQDSRIKFVSCSWGGINNYRELGMDGKTKFFNTGVLLIDLKKWREEDISEKVIRCDEENRKHVKYWDQYGLNVVLKDRWRELDPRWNQFPETLDVNPYIMHFVGKKPIDWMYDGNYKNLFLEYLSMTKWSLYEQGPFIKLTKKLLSTVGFR
ncbi:MAG: glycosyltransferase family 8 protein [Candidatus Neomarinimicrobiota bacterium]